MLSSLPCYPAFCWSAIQDIFKVFQSCLSLFVAEGGCLSWSLPSITEQQVCPHSIAVLIEESLTRLCVNTESTMDDKDSPSPWTPTIFLIQQSWVIITFHCWGCCEHAYKWRKWHCKWSHIVIQWPVWIALFPDPTHKRRRCGYTSPISRASGSAEAL